MVGVEVEVIEGTLRGRVVTAHPDKTYYSFQGVPYAKPPVGELRFKSPRAPDPWKGIRDATTEGSMCLQFKDELEGSEDCLYLNIYTPKLPGQDGGTLQPVMVFIHGGGLYFGSGNADRYGPGHLVDAGVILVTLNYRLGILGFLGVPHPEVSVNAGMKDQVAALRWVRDNIAQFGGDPENVTLFGESAGGSAVELHMMSPMSKGLFHKAISQSGSSLAPFAYIRSSKDRAFRLAEALGHKTDSTDSLVKFLQNTPAETLVLHHRKGLSEEHFLKGLNPFLSTLEFAEQEGVEVFLPGEPEDLLDRGEVHKVPYITGINNMEGKTSVLDVLEDESLWRNKEETFERYVPADLGLPVGSVQSVQLAKRIKQFYFGDQPLSKNSMAGLINLLSDIKFVNSHWLSVKKHICLQKYPVYEYQFCFDGKLNRFRYLGRNFDIKGAAHTDELPYLFTQTEKVVDVDPKSPEMIVLRRMVEMWTNFAKTGNPNSRSEVIWTPITSSETSYLVIDVEQTIKSSLEKARMEFWVQVYQDFKIGSKSN